MLTVGMGTLVVVEGVEVVVVLDAVLDAVQMLTAGAEVVVAPPMGGFLKM